MPKRKAKFFVVVGEPWPDELEISEKKPEIDPRVKAAMALVLGAGVLVTVFAVFSLIRGDRMLLDKVFALVERVILLAVGWFGHGKMKGT